MKINTPILVTSLLFSLIHCAPAAILSAFDFQASKTGVWYQDPLVTTSIITPNGGLTRAGTSPNNITGWDVSPTINVNSGKSLTYDISVADGYEMTLTSFEFGCNAIGTGATRLTLGAWGYRVDGGDWVLNQFSLPSVNTFQTWTFSETVVVRDIIEFGFFAAGATQPGGIVQATGQRTGDDLIVNGTITAVPEPSSLLLGALASLAFLRRRR